MKTHSAFALFAALPLLLAGNTASATTTSLNTGSLGAPANGTNADPVTLVPGAVAAGGDLAANYNGVGGTNTNIPFQSGLNPSSGNAFSIEFWANPTTSDNDDSPVSNRVASSSPRSGWVFFQRAAGWNFRMYSGTGSNLGWDLTGGTSTLGTWSHVVATWDGSAAQLFVNGVLADNVNDATGGGPIGTYTASLTANFFVGSTDTGSPYNGAVDEVALYGSALTAAQISSHFALATGGAAGVYHSTVLADGARLQLTNNPVPESSSLAFLGLTGLALLRRRGR